MHRQNRPEEALAELDKLRIDEPGDPGQDNLRAAVVGRIGAFDEALELYETILARSGRHAQVWQSYGHTLKTVGRLDEGIAAYRKSIALKPWFGEAWWSIANLKTAKLGAEDQAAMLAALDAPEATPDDRFHIHFALGKALDDSGDGAAAFAHYAEANRLRRDGLPYAAAETTRAVDREIARFDAAFFAERAGQGCAAPDPAVHPGHAARRIDPDRADPCVPFAG